MIDFTSMSTSIGLFYALRLGNDVLYRFIFKLFVKLFLKRIFLNVCT